MRSFIKLYGPPVLEAIGALEKIAVDIPEVCIMDTLIEKQLPWFSDPENIRGYFSSLPTMITLKRCGNIISKSEESIGEYDFYFEWFTEPKMEQLKSLIKKIDEALAPLGVRYSITTKKKR
ncbi:MAG: hypothetical protein ACETVY_02705 [Candidatus Bathyarchaeia archaeon]